MHLVTREKTILPIGDSGFFVNPQAQPFHFPSRHWEVKRFEDTHFYKMICYGSVLDPIFSDEFCAESKNCEDVVIFDAHNNIVYESMSIERINPSLVAIFDLEDDVKSWENHNTVTIRNPVTNQVTIIKGKVPICYWDDPSICIEKKFHMFTGYSDFDKNREPIITWRAFINKKGNLIYSGFCWEYKFDKKRSLLSIKKRRTSRKWQEISV